MKDIKKVAIITTSREQFERYLRINEVSERTCKMVRIKKDIEDEEFLSIEKIEGSQNVTDWVINNIFIFGEDNSQKQRKTK